MYPRASAALLAAAHALALGLLATAALGRDSNSGSAAAWTSAPRVLIVQGRSEDWVRRVQGQLSNLPASIATAGKTPQLDAALAREELRRRLQRLAEQRAAALVASIVRLDTAGETSLVAIWFSEAQVLYTRVLAQDWGRLSVADRSGALELAALSVRSAVRALTLDPEQLEAFAEPQLVPSETASSAGGERSVVSPPAAPMSLEAVAARTENVLVDPSAVAEPSLVDPSVVVTTSGVRSEHSAEDGIADGAGASDASASLALRWSSELGMVGYLPGEPALAAFALQAGLGVASGAWGLTLLGQLGLPSSSELGPARIELQRYALLAELGYSGRSAGVWQFGPLLRGGFTLTQRETRSENPALAASRSTSQQSLLLGGGWSSEYRWSERLGFFLRAVLDWQASPAKYAVVTSTGERVVIAESWVVQPSVEIGGNWHW